MKIIVTIATDGTVKGDVREGPGGAGCVKELLALLEDLGEQETMRRKPAYYQREAETHARGKQGQS